MALKSHFTYGASNSKAPKSKKNDPSSYVRVIKVLLDINDPDCKDASMINGVIYRNPSSASDEGTTKGKSFAYQGNVNNRVIPLPGELVKLDSKPAIKFAFCWSLGFSYSLFFISSNCSIVV